MHGCIVCLLGNFEVLKIEIKCDKNGSYEEERTMLFCDSHNEKK